MDPYGNPLPIGRDQYGQVIDPRTVYSDPLGRSDPQNLASAFEDDGMSESVVLDIEDDFGPINPDGTILTPNLVVTVFISGLLALSQCGADPYLCVPNSIIRCSPSGPP